METWRNIKRNLDTFIVFQLLYVTFGSALLGTVMYFVFHSAVAVSVGYLAAHTVKPFLLSPVCWLALAFLLVIIAFYSLFGIITVVYLNECGRQDQSAGLRGTIGFSAKATARALRPQNWKVIFLVVLILPVLNIGVIPVTGAFVIPDFIMEYIGYYWYLTVLYAAAIVGLVFLMMRWKFAINAMVVERLPFREAFIRSARIGKGHQIEDFLRLIARQVFVFVLAGICFVLGVAVAYLFGALSAVDDGMSKAILGFVSAVFFVSGVSLGASVLLLNVPICYSFISSLYYRRSGQTGIEIPPMDLGKRYDGKGRIVRYALLAVVSFALVMGSSAVIVGAFDGTLKDYVSKEDVRDVVGDYQVGVVAHRCGAHFAPENTVAALNKAADMGATWCELDAQQLADGTIIVMHDTNFARTTGFDKNSWEATWDEVEPLDAGSSYSADYAGEKIPLLDQMIKAAKARGVKLQIEVKPTGNEANLETAVIDIIKQNDFQDDCVFASQNYDSLKIAREYDPTIRTLYITSVAFGDILKADAADDFSIEATWVTQDVVDLLHGADRKVFAWTVNSAEIMERLISLDIDALVTDEVGLAITETEEGSSGSISQGIIELLGL